MEVLTYYAEAAILQTSSKMRRESGCGARHMVRYVFRKGTQGISALVFQIILQVCRVKVSSVPIPIVAGKRVGQRK